MLDEPSGGKIASECGRHPLLGKDCHRFPCRGGHQPRFRLADGWLCLRSWSPAVCSAPPRESTNGPPERGDGHRLAPGEETRHPSTNAAPIPPAIVYGRRFHLQLEWEAYRSWGYDSCQLYPAEHPA